MIDDPVIERGILTAPAQTWDTAAQRAKVIRCLAGQETVGLDAADAAAAELGVSRRQVYALIKWWRAGGGVVSDLLLNRSSGGRGGARLADEVESIVRDVLQKRYLIRQRRIVVAIGREIARECRIRGLPVPQRRHCSRWQPHAVHILTCPQCGDGPILGGDLATEATGDATYGDLPSAVIGLDH